MTRLIELNYELVNGKQYLLLETGKRPSEKVTDNPNDIASLGGENISEEGFMKFDNVRYISKEYFKVCEKGKIQEGDILINKDGAQTGKIAFVSEIPFGKSMINEHIFIIRNSGEFNQKFLFYFLLSFKGQKQIKSKIVGSAQGGISTGFIKGIYLPKPDKSIQEKISSILSIVDKNIEQTKKTIEKVEKLKKSMMQKLLTGKIKPDGKERQENEFKETKIGFIPEDWEVKRLFKITKKITDGEHLSPELTDEGKILISAEDVYFEGIKIKNKKFVSEANCEKFRTRCNPDYGDILVVSRGASIGRTCKVNIDEIFCMMGSVILIKPRSYILLGEYISHFLKSNFAWLELQRLSGTTAQQAIYLTHLKKMRIIYPKSIEEQKKIADILNNFEYFYSNKIKKLETLFHLKKSLMQNLLTGKIEVK